MADNTKKNVVSFICELPPPYGGVTVKNALIIDALARYGMPIEVIDIYIAKRKKTELLLVLFRIFRSFVERRKVVYGVGSYKLLYKLLRVQSIIGGKRSIAGTSNIVMGGSFPDFLSSNKKLIQIIKNLNVQLVETNQNIKELLALGITNALYFPNPKQPSDTYFPFVNDSHEIKLLFFSKICKEKGVQSIIKTTQILDENSVFYRIDFFGEIDPEISREFSDFIDHNDRAYYNGVFDSTSNNVYSKMSEYDILLFPSTWEGEGVPGVLVEAKMAGLVVIASDFAFNSEIIIEDQDEGFLIRRNYEEEMADLIKKLDIDREKLNYYKKMSFKSRERYTIDNYKNTLLMVYR